ncbi:MAG: hypothetical protein ACO25N_05240 [Candidatus Limnocylindrus sp.]
MDAQWLPYAVVVGTAVLAFLFNMVASPRLMRALNSPVEVNAPLRRPRIIAGKSLVTIWFVSAALYLATLPQVLELPSVDLDGWSLPALVFMLLISFSATTYKRSLAQQVEEQLDERELAARNGLYPLAHQTVLTFASVLFVIFFILQVGQDEITLGTINSETALGAAITLLFFFWVTPSLVHAWRDPVPDEVSEEMRRALKDAKGELRRELRGLSIEIDAAGAEVKHEIRKSMGLGKTSNKKKRSPRGLKVAVNGRLVKGAPPAKKRANPVKKGKRS